MSWGKSRKLRKYRAGERLNSLVALVLIINDGRYIIVNGRPYHPAVLRNWSLASLDGTMRRGRMYLAELTPEWIEDQEMRAELAKFNAEHPDDSEFAEVEAGEKP
jgi:hypothetical protein